MLMMEVVDVRSGGTLWNFGIDEDAWPGDLRESLSTEIL